MEKLSRKFKDDSVPPEKLVVYWTEYVIRHKGALHLKFSGADKPAYEYFLIDVTIFIVISTISILFLAKFLVKFIKLIKI